MPAITHEMVRLAGELTAFSVRGDDGWGTGTLQAQDGAHGIVGKLVGVQVGATVELEGSWDEHPRYGRRLKVRACTAVQPRTADGIVAWLSSTLPDVGHRRALQLVERFGAELWAVIEQDHRALCQVDGITPKRADAIRDAYQAHRAERDYMIRLRGWGLTDAQIARALEQWRSLATVCERVQQNPYQLSQYVYGFGFLRSDAVAMRAGVRYDSPFRCTAGVEHVLEEQMGKGHCYLPSGALMAMARKLLGVEEQLVAAAVRTAIRNGRAVRRGARVYSSRLDEAEEQCATALRRLLGRAA